MEVKIYNSDTYTKDGIQKWKIFLNNSIFRNRYKIIPNEFNDFEIQIEYFEEEEYLILSKFEASIWI